MFLFLLFTSSTNGDSNFLLCFLMLKELILYLNLISPLIFTVSCGGILPSFKLDPGVNYEGGEIKKTKRGSSASSCAWTCLDLSGCTAFSHNASDGTCSFKNSSAARVVSSGVDSWTFCSNPVYGVSVAKATVSSQSSLAMEEPQLRRRLLQKAQGPSQCFFA